MINQVDYVELGLACADVCKVLDRGLEGRSLDDLNNSVLEAISQLKTCVTPNNAHFEQFIHDPLGFVSELWRRSGRESSSRANEMWFLGISTQSTTRRRLPPGGWTSSGSFTSSTYVPSFSCGDCRLCTPDRTCDQYTYNCFRHSCHGLRHSSYHGERSGDKRW